MELKQALMAKKAVARKTGLIGLFGHIYVLDNENPDRMKINCQFEIIRQVPPDRWLVQLFSWLDGRPTEVRAYLESFLLGGEVKLYLEHDEWCAACNREFHDRRDHQRYLERQKREPRSIWIDDFK